MTPVRGKLGFFNLVCTDFQEVVFVSNTYLLGDGVLYISFFPSYSKTAHVTPLYKKLVLIETLSRIISQYPSSATSPK